MAEQSKSIEEKFQEAELRQQRADAELRKLKSVLGIKKEDKEVMTDLSGQQIDDDLNQLQQQVENAKVIE